MECYQQPFKLYRKRVVEWQQGSFRVTICESDVNFDLYLNVHKRWWIWQQVRNGNCDSPCRCLWSARWYVQLFGYSKLYHSRKLSFGHKCNRKRTFCLCNNTKFITAHQTYRSITSLLCGKVYNANLRNQVGNHQNSGATISGSNYETWINNFYLGSYEE